jgi:outer membrane murein-binding lipoprotein Lpp
MKRFTLAAALLLAVAVLSFAGCGKSDEMKRLEAGLNTEVMQKHDELMKDMSGLDAAVDQINALVAKHDSLAKLFPKKFAGHDATDLLTAKEKLESAKSAMNAWMKEFKPYDPQEKHETVMASLKKTKDDLGVIEHQFQESLTLAKESMANHTKVLEDLAKTSKKLK